MIDPEVRVQIRRYFYAEHWKVGTIAQALGVHPDTVKRAIEVERFHRAERLRASMLDAYLPLVRQTLEAHPRLRATRLHQMLQDRGYRGNVQQVRRVVARLRPRPQEAFLRLHVFVGEQAQVDWASFGTVMVGRARRALSCFVMTLSWSRALYLEFFFDQTMENFLRGHVNAFASFHGSARILLYDNLKSAVLERRGSLIHFNPRLLELAGHYHFEPNPCQVRAGNQKGRVERAIRFVRDSFWAARTFATLEECNRQALKWRDEVAHQRPWPDDRNRTVAEVFAEERPRLLPLPAHEFSTDRVVAVRSAKTIYVRFDGNDYSIPPEAVGRELTLAASDTEVRILDGVRRSPAIAAAMTASRWFSIRRTSRLCCAPSARPVNRRAAAVWSWLFPRVRSCWSGPSPKANRPRIRSRNCSSCWIAMAPAPCAALFAKRFTATRRVPLR